MLLDEDVGMDSSVGWCIATQLSHANRDHFDGLDGIVVAGANFGNLFDKVQVFNDLEDRFVFDIIRM